MINILRLKLNSNNLFQDSFWALIGNLFGKGLSVFSGILLAKILGKDGFGEYSLIKNPLFASSMFFTFGFGYLVTKLISVNLNNGFIVIKKIIKWSTSFTLIFSGVISLVLLLFSNYISINYFGDLSFGSSIRVFSIWNILNSYYTLQIGIISGFRSFKKLVFISIASGLVLVSFTYFGSINYGILGAIWALVLYQFIHILLNVYLIRNSIKLIEEKNPSNESSLKFKDLVLEVIPVGIQEGVYSVFTWITSLIILKFSSTSDFGLYNAAIQWSSIVLFIPGILRSVMLAHFSNANNQKMKKEMIKNVLLLNFFVVIIPAALVALISGRIEAYYGSAYAGLGLLIIVSMIISVQLSFSNIYSQLFLSERLNWVMLLIKLLKEAIVVGILVILFTKVKYNISDSLKILISSIIGNTFLLTYAFFYYKKHSEI